MVAGCGAAVIGYGGDVKSTRVNKPHALVKTIDMSAVADI
jgi:hypothetical protein